MSVKKLKHYYQIREQNIIIDFAHTSFISRPLIGSFEEN